MRQRLGIENHFVKISTLMKDCSLPEKLEEEDVPMARMVEAEKFLYENEHYTPTRTSLPATSSSSRSTTTHRRFS